GPVETGFDRGLRRRHHREAIRPAVAVKELLRGGEILDVVNLRNSEPADLTQAFAERSVGCCLTEGYSGKNLVPMALMTHRQAEASSCRALALSSLSLPPLSFCRANPRLQNAAAKLGLSRMASL